MLAAAVARLAQDWRIEAAAPIVDSAAIGPSLRRYANGAVIVSGPHDPPKALALLKRTERDFGVRRRGQPWRARVLDCDIVLWDGGVWRDPALTIPHPLFRERRFVLVPASRIAPRWRDPLSGLTLRQLAARAP